MFRRHPYLSAATFGYLAVVAWLTLSPQVPDQRDGPLWQLTLFLHRFSATQWLTFNDLEFVANIVLFVPLGLFFVLLVGKRQWWLALGLAVVLTVGIELVQQFIPSRVSDVRDILSNSLGAGIGVLITLSVAAARQRARAARGCYRVGVTSDPSLAPVQRRVAVVPVIVAVVALLVFAVIVTIVITLAAAPAPTGGSQPPAPSDRPSAHSADGAAPESSAVAPTVESTGARCVDVTAETDALDIDEVSVALSDRDDLTVEFTLTSGVPDGAAQLGIYAESADDERAYQFSVELDDGDIESVTSYEFDRDKRDRMNTDDAGVDGSVVRFGVPHNIAKKLGDDWSWFAFTTLDEVSVDACPSDPGSFKTLTFERDD
jgi:VanZ family protein